MSERAMVTLTIRHGKEGIKASFSQRVRDDWSLADCAKEFTEIVKQMTEKLPTFRLTVIEHDEVSTE